MTSENTIWSIDQASVFAEGLDHPECVAAHPDGSIWAGGEAGQIYRVAPDGSEVREVASTGGFILGIAFSPDLSWLLVCDVGQQCLWRLDLATEELSMFSKGARGHRFTNPNYASFAADGTLYVSDSGNFRQINGLITRYDADHSGNGEIWCEGPFNFANGLCLSLEEDALYVVCSFMPGVERIAINDDGSAGTREVFVTLPRTVPDGVALDADGNLYVSCYSPNQIYRVAPDGSKELLLDDWDMHTLSNPTNIAFGGPNLDILYTANLGRWHVTSIETDVKGAPLPCFR
ncbi:MAG: SMP-30/gluconolactonase/LRE family protein [Rhodothermales bacterium]|jgi:sugar lactone lactonase YvrE